MAFIVETGVGIENANAYASVEFCDGYNATQVDGQSWADFDLADKQIRIVTATMMLDRGYDFGGRPVTHFQGLEFPRYGLRDRAGHVLPSAPLPRAIKCATAELARVLGDRVDAGGTATGAASSSSSGTLKSVQIGSIAMTFDTQSSSSSGSSSSSSANQPVALIPRSVTSWLLDIGIPRFGYGSARLIR